MDCGKADEYFMKFIDNCLTVEEAEKLHKHLAVCEKCRTDFSIYDSIVKEFSVAELFEAPEGLEINVMEKIKELPTPKVQVEKTINTLLVIIGILFITIMASGFIIFLNRDIILEWMSGYPQLAGYVALLAPVSDYVAKFTGNIWTSAVSLSTAASSFMDGFKYVLLVIAIVLFVIQIALRTRSKDKVEE